MPLTSLYAKRTLDWWTGAAAAAAPGGRWVQWATGSPNDAGASDGAFSSRRTVTFAGANSPQGSATNAAAITGATASAAATVVGWNLYESSVGGNRIAYGTLTASLGCKSGADNPRFNTGGLNLVIS